MSLFITKPDQRLLTSIVSPLSSNHINSVQFHHSDDLSVSCHTPAWCHTTCVCNPDNTCGYMEQRPFRSLSWSAQSIVDVRLYMHPPQTDFSSMTAEDQSCQTIFAACSCKKMRSSVIWCSVIPRQIGQETASLWHPLFSKTSDLTEYTYFTYEQH